MILGALEAQRAGIRSAADALVPRPMLALALPRAVPRYHITLAARAMEFALGAAHRARRLGVALLHLFRCARCQGAALLLLLHWFTLLVYHVDGVRRAALPAAVTTTRVSSWAANYKDWAKLAAGRLLASAFIELDRGKYLCRSHVAAAASSIVALPRRGSHIYWHSPCEILRALLHHSASNRSQNN